MQEKWQGKGLSILAVTDEGKSETEKWVANKGAKYAYAYDKGGKLGRYFGVSGIPHAVLIDASGTVVWKGHPGALDEESLQRSVAGALAKPLWEWADSAKGVKSALLKRAYKSALDQAAKLGAAEGGPEIKAAIEGLVKSRIQGMKDAYSKGDFFRAQETAGALQRELEGLPEKEEASRVLADLQGNKDAAAVIKAQQKIAKLRAGGLEKRKEIEAAKDDLRKILEEMAGTYAATEAQAMLDDLAQRDD